MSAWDYPLVIVATLVVALLVYRWLMRSGEAARVPSFSCLVCGRQRQEREAKDWRYCPYCGAPKDARQLSAIAQRVLGE